MQCLTCHVSVIRMTNRGCELITRLAINRLKSFSRSLSILHGISDSDEVTCTCLSVFSFNFVCSSVSETVVQAVLAVNFVAVLPQGAVRFWRKSGLGTGKFFEDAQR